MDREDLKTGYKLIDLEENPIYEMGQMIEITAKYYVALSLTTILFIL